MPASMIMAEAGGRPNVKGKSIATVVSGEMPGSTPTSVPISTPARQNSRFCQLAAVARPSARLSNSSTGPSPGSELGPMLGPVLNQERRPELERQTEAFDEQQRRESGQAGPNRASRPQRTGPVAVPATSTLPTHAAISPRVENSAANIAIAARIAISGRHAGAAKGSGAP